MKKINSPLVVISIPMRRDEMAPAESYVMNVLDRCDEFCHFFNEDLKSILIHPGPKWRKMDFKSDRMIIFQLL